MKILITILISLLTLSTFAQKNQAIDLRWKISKNEKVHYLTIMNEIDTTSLEMNLGSLFKSLSDSNKNSLKESKDFFNKLNQTFKNQDYIITLLNKGKSIIDIVMTVKPKESAKGIKKDTSNGKEDELIKMMQSMNQGIMLRGSVYETGEIHSFWLESRQKNLIALLFELPGKPIKIGDKWPLDINLIANDQSFSCDSSYKVNKVVLTDIKKVNGETIAVLKYTIDEYVKGSLLSNRNNFQAETMMRFVYQGIAEFSVDKGRWVTYDGIMSFETTGVMKGNKKTKFTLITAGK